MQYRQGRSSSAMKKSIVTGAVIAVTVSAILGIWIFTSTSPQLTFSSRTDGVAPFGDKRVEHARLDSVHRKAQTTVHLSNEGQLSNARLLDGGLGTSEGEAGTAALKAANKARQANWRAIFSSELKNDEWTQSMLLQLRQNAAAVLDNRAVSVYSVDCRETLCRMHLQFEDQLDASAFHAAMRDPSLESEFQSLDPEFDGAGFDRSDNTYELMVHRPGPKGLGEPSPAERTALETPAGLDSGGEAVAGMGAAQVVDGVVQENVGQVAVLAATPVELPVTTRAGRVERSAVAAVGDGQAMVLTGSER